MSLLEYKNIDEIINATDPLKAQTITETDINLLKIKDVPVQVYQERDNSLLLKSDELLELFIYSNVYNSDTILSVQNMQDYLENYAPSEVTYTVNDFFQTEIDTVTDNSYIKFYVEKFFELIYPYYDGEVKVAINYIRKVVSSESLDELRVFNISPSRYEARVKYVLNNSEFDFFKKLKDLEDTDISISKNYFLNFGNNKLYTILNMLIESKDSIIFRFYDPLPLDINVSDACFVCEKIINTNVITADIVSKITSPEEDVEFLEPNFLIKVKERQETNSTYLTLNSLISGSSNLILSNISSSSEPLNIDFEKYENFVFYSSATERLDNFVYKLKDVENYDSDIQTYTTTLGTLTTGTLPYIQVSQSLVNLNVKKDKVIQSFTSYERYLYFESSSYLSSSVEERFDASWPKSTSTKPYTLYAVTSSTAINWYATQSYSASLYDKTNVNKLTNAVPLFIQEDSQNNEYIKFVNMIAEYLDEVRLYISSITERDIYKLKENEGMTTFIALNLINHFGNNILIDMDIDSLEKYLNNSNDTSLRNLTIQQKKNVLLKRILNNMIFILKSKGSFMSFHNLATLFGIDVDYYNINEFGGTDPTYIDFDETLVPQTSLENTEINYTLTFNGGQSVELSWMNYG